MKFNKQKSRKHNLMATSIMMLFVIMLSLSTATFAWFSANTIVGTNTIGFTAEHTAQADISLSWLDPNDPQWKRIDEIGFDGSKPLQPAIPSSLPTPDPGGTTFNDFKADFFTSTINWNDKFNSDGEPVSVFTSANPNGNGQNYFYVINHGDTPVNVTASIDWNSNDETNLPLLRVALFCGDTQSELKYLKTITAKDAPLTGTDENGEEIAFSNTYYGEIVSGHSGTTFETIETAESASFDISANSNKVFAFVAWFDGVYLKEYRAKPEYNIEIALKFEGTATNPTVP